MHSLVSCSPMRFATRFAGSLVGTIAALTAARASGHGFGQRFDLPLPLWLWLTGAGMTIAMTFVVMALFVKEKRFTVEYPRLDLLRFRVVRWAANAKTIAIIRLLAVLLFVLTVCAGLVGNQNPYSNLITTMVWVMWWVGMAFVCALIGDLWTLVNPLRTLFVLA